MDYFTYINVISSSYYYVFKCTYIIVWFYR